jgi:CcmD family protein
VPVETPDTFSALFWAYTAVWLILSVYVWGLGVRLKKLESRTDDSNE